MPNLEKLIILSTNFTSDDIMFTFLLLAGGAWVGWGWGGFPCARGVSVSEEGSIALGHIQAKGAHCREEEASRRKASGERGRGQTWDGVGKGEVVGTRRSFRRGHRVLGMQW